MAANKIYTDPDLLYQFIDKGAMFEAHVNESVTDMKTALQKTIYGSIIRATWMTSKELTWSVIV